MNSAFIAITLSVLMHVAWNLLARHVDSRCNYLWWGLLAHLVMLGPWAIWRLIADGHWNSELVVTMLVSATANSLYFIALRKSYHYAPVALVYPLVRSSPVLIACWAWLVFGQNLSVGGMIGIGVSVLGLWGLAITAKNGDTKHALPWALVAAFATSIYSLSDKAAVVYLPSFGAQLGFISIGYLASFSALSLIQYVETKSIVPKKRPRFSYILIGGLFIGVAYALVVRAMLELPAAYVVAYTNAGIVLATIFSIWIFKERENWLQRTFAASIITTGLVVLGLVK